MNIISPLRNKEDKNYIYLFCQEIYSQKSL